MPYDDIPHDEEREGPDSFRQLLMEYLGDLGNEVDELAGVIVFKQYKNGDTAPLWVLSPQGDMRLLEHDMRNFLRWLEDGRAIRNRERFGSYEVREGEDDEDA